MGKILDHKGNEFSSIVDMCNHWNVNVGTYYNRIAKGYDLETALTGHIPSGNPSKCKDHLGNEFPSVKKMCEYWHIPYSKYINRKRAGYSLKDNLTLGNIDNRAKKCKDFEGREFNSLKDMCHYWGITYAIYQNRRSHGYSLHDALVGKQQPRT